MPHAWLPSPAPRKPCPAKQDSACPRSRKLPHGPIAHRRGPLSSAKQDHLNAAKAGAVGQPCMHRRGGTTVGRKNALSCARSVRRICKTVPQISLPPPSMSLQRQQDPAKGKKKKKKKTPKKKKKKKKKKTPQTNRNAASRRGITGPP